eukprot:GHVR01083454.1.p4 GENE.GHVR01083454.1~~GHVR01083454.1.p4  ORF type:complete len:100 (+),score=3.31 GHVR01083454.1:3480-3779(+)
MFSMWTTYQSSLFQLCSPPRVSYNANYSVNQFLLGGGDTDRSIFSNGYCKGIDLYLNKKNQLVFSQKCNLAGVITYATPLKEDVGYTITVSFNKGDFNN